MNDNQLDTVGYWTEIKLLILKEYANAYARVLKNQPHIKHVAYIDAFAGAGAHISKTSGEHIDGSPALVLSILPPLLSLPPHRSGRGPCQAIAPTAPRGPRSPFTMATATRFFSGTFSRKCRYEDFRRALCLLDPYKLNPNWEVVETAGKMRSIEIFLNFMIMDANMNVLWTNPDRVPPDQARRMTAFWGDDSWRKAAYKNRARSFRRHGRESGQRRRRRRLP